jgi:formyl-CoA transferase
MSWPDAAPLQGVKILDLCRVVSGPFATMQLGDLGADVVKIEEPGKGDESRSYGPPFVGGESAYFLSINRNKRSCAVDLKSAAGKELILRLAAKADVVVENFRPGTLERLGLGFDVLSKQNEALILCSISGFGRTGPEVSRPGYDLIVQGESGIMDITGEADGPPLKVGTSIADLVTGLYAAQAVLSALLQRGRSGQGGRIDVSMLDSLASLLTFNAGMYFASGMSPKRRGNAHPTISPYETFEASDGWVNLGVANDKFWQLFCEALQRPDLQDDPRFARAQDRAAHRAILKDILAPVFRRETRRHWTALLSSAGIPCGEIKSVGEVCESSQLVDRGMVRSLDHPTAGRVGYIASPLRFDDRVASTVSPPPRLGENTAEILQAWLGMSAGDLQAYREKGAFGSADGS